MSNVGGAGLLAAGACAELGLTVHQPHGLTRRRLRTLLPGGTVTGPVDTTAAISAEAFRRCLELLAADDGVDAMIALVQPTGANGDLITAIQDADIRVPLAAVVLDQAETVRLMPRPASPETTARFRSTTFRRRRPPRWPTRPGTGPGAPRPRGQVPSFPDVRADDARALVTGFLHREPGGGWLPPDKTADLLHCYGIWLVDAEPAGSEDEAVRAAAAVSGPVVLKAEVPGLVPGTEVKIGVTDDRVFGPLVTFGPSDHAARLTPLTDTDADALIRSIDAAPRLLGQRGAPATDLETLRELLLRVSRLADDLPEVTELDLSPVIARPHGGVRDGRADQGDTLPAAGPLSSQAALTGPGPGARPRRHRAASPAARELVPDSLMPLTGTAA